MSSSREPRHNTQANVHQKYSGDGQTTYEIMQTVTDKYEISQGLFAACPRPMTVMPMQKLFKYEKQGKTRQEPGKKHSGISDFLHSCWNHMEEGATDERARRESNERQNNLLQGGFLEYQGNTPHQRDGTHQEAASNNPGQGAHKSLGVVIIDMLTL